MFDAFQEVNACSENTALTKYTRSLFYAQKVHPAGIASLEILQPSNITGRDNTDATPPIPSLYIFLIHSRQSHPCDRVFFPSVRFA